jgi:hypothetical protein
MPTYFTAGSSSLPPMQETCSQAIWSGSEADGHDRGAGRLARPALLFESLFTHLGRHHAKFGVQPSQYIAMGEALMWGLECKFGRRLPPSCGSPGRHSTSRCRSRCCARPRRPRGLLRGPREQPSRRADSPHHPAREGRRKACRYCLQRARAVLQPDRERGGATGTGQRRTVSAGVFRGDTHPASTTASG